MKVAYVTSLYPAVSHTFILNEVLALRRLGLEIGCFSVNRPSERDILGAEAAREAAATRSILPLPPGQTLKAVAWCLGRRLPALTGVLKRVLPKGGGLKARLKWTAYLLEGILLAYWLSKDGYGHLHCHFGNSGSNAAQIAAQIAGIPFSITCHGSELNDPYGFRLPQKARDAAFIACVSKFGRARLMHVCDRRDWEKFKIVRCGLAPSAPDPYPGISDAPADILCVGRLSPEKGHFILFDAFEALQRKGLAARLTIVGDGPLRRELEERAASLPKPENVAFTGSLEPRLVAERIRASSLVVLASFSEGVPVVLMEAFQHGRPAVATRVGGIPELVDQGESGLVVSPGDSGELAEAIEKIMANPLLAENMGKKGSEKILGEFNEAFSAQKLKTLFEAAQAGDCGRIM
jgi:glycosyltransferase involved in cell wall biosynthesis